MKKLYAVLAFELVLLLLVEVFVGYKIIQSETVSLIERIESDMPEMSFDNEWKDPALSDANREKAIEDYKEWLRLKKLGLVKEKTIDMGLIPGTIPYEMQKQREEKELREKMVLENLDALRKSHETKLGSVEDRFGDLNINIQNDADYALENNYKDLLQSISFEVYNNDVYYIYTYLPGKAPTSADISNITLSDIDYEKDTIEGVTGKRPDHLTILYLSSDGDVLFQMTN